MFLKHHLHWSDVLYPSLLVRFGWVVVVVVVGGGEVIRGVGLNREGCSMRLLRYLGKTPKTGLKTRINIRRLYYCGN